MAIFRTELVTPWEQVKIGDEPTNVPQVSLEFPLAKWSDVTAQAAANLPPEPNLLVIEALLDEQDLKAIGRDPRYVCLWSEPASGASAEAEPADAVASGNHMSNLRGLLGRSGVEESKLDEALGTEPERTRGQVSDRLKNWLKTRPRATAVARS